MKAKKYFLLGLFLFIGILSSSAQCRVDAGENATIVCGDSVQLYGEPNWMYGLDQFPKQMHGVFFTDSNTGYTVGDAGEIRKTTDGGTTWNSQIASGSAILKSVFFVNANTGYTVGAGIYKTVNGGNVWVQQALGSTDILNTVHFINADTGFVVGEKGKIFKTINGGTDWVQKASNTTNALVGISFPSKNIGYVCAGASILKTSDGGETWSSISAGTNYYYTAHFIDINTGFVIGTDGTQKCVFQTQNGGTTWTKYILEAANGSLECVFFTDANTGYIGSISRIFKTNDGGKSWKWDLGPMRTEAIHFPNPKVGYAVHYNPSPGMSRQTIKYVIPDAVSWTPATGLSSTTIANPIARPTATTTYKVTTTTGTCTITDSVTIYVNPLTANAGADKTLTCGATALLDVNTNYTGTGALTYSWSPSTGLNAANIFNPAATPAQTTKYYVTVTTPNGCTAIDSVTVFVNPLSADAGFDETIICGGTALLNLSTNYTGTGILSYSWLPTSSLNATNIANPAATTTQTTKYYATVTTPNGCTATDSITVFVNPLLADAGIDKTIVCGGTAQLDNVSSNYTGTGILTYSWSPATGLNSATIANPASTVTQTTKYYVTVTTSNGCTTIDSVTVNVNPLTAQAGTDKTHVCGGSVQLDNVVSNYTGSGTLTYSWLPLKGLNNTTIPNPTSTEAGITYTVTVATPNGCIAFDSVAVNLIPMNAIDICIVGVDSSKNLVIWNKPTATAIDSIYIYKETTVSGNYIKIGSVSNDSASVFRDISSHPEVKSNKYKISVLDSCGLETSGSPAHKTMHLSINQGIGTSWNLIWENYEGFAVSTYKIYRGTNSTNLQFRDAVSGGSNQYTDYNPPIGSLYYQIEVVSPNMCNSSSPVNFTRSNVARNSAVGIHEIPNTLAFSIYPNPATDKLTVEVERNNNAAVLTIYNAIGALVKTVILDQNSQQVNMSELENGFYTIEIKSAAYSGQQKLIIQK